ncbi:MAG: alpha/beta hydrolase [Acidobacteriota bacterium]
MHQQKADLSIYTWRSPEFGQAHKIQLRQGYIQYYEQGTGPTMVFIHGWLTNANLWRKVVPYLAKRFRCIIPDMPFGAHLVALQEDADLTPAGCGQLIIDFLNALKLSDVTLIGNDSGGVYAQIATATNSERISRLILNSCETPYDSFPPTAFVGLVEAAQTQAGLAKALEVLRQREFRTNPRAYGLLAKRPIEDIVSDSYALPLLNDTGILRDAHKVISSASERYIQWAGDKLISGFEHPVLFIWSSEDNFFPLKNAQQYAAALKNATVETVADAYSFTPEDQPASLVEIISAFMDR